MKTLTQLMLLNALLEATTVFLGLI